MTDHRPVGGLPRSHHDDHPDPPSPTPPQAGDDPTAGTTAAGELLADVFPHLDADHVVRALDLRLRPREENPR